MEVLKAILDLVSNYGIAITLAIYFIYKDYKFNEKLITLTDEIKECMAVIKEKLGKEGENV